MHPKLAGLHPEVRHRAEVALSWAQFYGVPVSVISGTRSCEQQKFLRDRWLRGLSSIPANRPGDSSHNVGLGWDSTTTPRFQPWWNHVREWVGFRVPAGDQNHAEVPGWRQFAPPGVCS